MPCCGERFAQLYADDVSSTREVHVPLDPGGLGPAPGGGQREAAAAPTSLSEIQVLAAALRQVPGLHEAVSRDKKRYSNLTSCILAAVFSINARYKVVIATVERYRAFYDLPPLGVPDVPAGTGEPSVSEFISQIEARGIGALGVEDFATNVLHNRMCTSSKGGVLKAQAALDFARVLRRYGIEEIGPP